MNHLVGLIIESLVAVLLMLTIGYCIMLNQRLKRLRADEQSLKATIAELITATEIAERAIGGLKLTVRECNDDLGQRLDSASDITAALDRRLAAGDDLLRRISRIVSASKPGNMDAVDRPAPPPVAAPQSIAAAAQAFTERRRRAGLAA